MKLGIRIKAQATPGLVKAGPGFARGPMAGHRYHKRVRRMVGGKLRWVYYYANDKDRKRWVEHTAKQLGQHQADLDEMEKTHRLKGEFHADHPELRAARKALKDLSIEYVTELLGWDRPPKITITDKAQAQFATAVHELYKGGDIEPDNLHGHHITPLRALEMAYGRMPAKIRQYFSGAVKDLIFSASGDSESELKIGKGITWAGYCRAGKEGSKIVMAMHRSQNFTLHEGMKGGLFPVEVLVHEMGHAIHNQLGAAGEGAHGNARPEGWTGPVWADWEAHCKRIEGKEPGVTDYAETNEKERWAESYTAAQMYPRELASRCPATYDWFRDFFGHDAMRPRHTNAARADELQSQKAAALASRDLAKVEEINRKIDAEVGVLDMPADDARLAWWKQPETKIQRALRAHQETLTQHPGFYVDENPDLDATGNRDHDRFYEINVSGRTVYMRYGKSSSGATTKGWDPDDPAGATLKPNPAELKELYDSDGKPLDVDSAWWYLHQEALKDDHPDVASFAGFGADEKKEEATFKKLKARKLSEMLLQMTRASWDPKQPDAKTQRPVEISLREYRQRSGTFTHNQWDVAGSAELGQLRHEVDPVKREALLADLVRKQPNLRRQQTRDAKGRIVKREIVMGPPAAPGEMPLPQFATKRYVNENPDGTMTVIECSQDESGEVTKSGRYFVDSPMWRALLTPNGEDVRGPEHLEMLCRQAASENRRAWISVRTDAKGGDAEHFYHVQVEFDGRGQPKLVGPEWKRRTGKDVPRLDDFLTGTGQTIESARPQVKADRIKLEKKPRESKKPKVPKINDRVILPVGGEEIGRKEGKDVVLRLIRIVPGKAAGVVPSPPGWDRMPDTDTPTLPGEPDHGVDGGILTGAKLTKIEKARVKAGTLPWWYRGTPEQRVWVDVHLDPAMAKWEATKEEETGREFPAQYVFAGEAGGGAGGKRFVRVGDAEAAKCRQPAATRRPEPLPGDLLVYDHTRVDPITGAVVEKEPRLLLPADGSMSAETLSEFPGITAVQDDDGTTGLRVNMVGFARLREHLGHVSLTGGAETLLRKRVDHLREIAAAAKKRTHKVELEDIDPTKLAAKGVGVKPTLPDGNRFELAHHQQELIQLLEDNGGRALGGHYMGCLSGDSVVNLNRAGKGFAMRIADVYDRQRQVRYAWDMTIPTMARSMVVEGVRIGLAEVSEVWDSGIKTTYRLTLADGRTIRTTDEHRFWTQRGWVQHGGLEVGDQVAVELPPRAPQGRAPKKAYQIRTNLLHHPHARGEGRAAMRFYVSTHRLVVEADMNGCDLEEWVARCRDGRDLEGATFLDPAVVVHHKDLDIRNNERSNLVVETTEEHGAEHGDADHFGAGRIGWVPVVARMSDPREERTYDITVTEDTPSYVANGMVVHNTGKTISAIVAAKMALARRDPNDPEKKAADAPRRVLIVAPLNTVEQWRQAADAFDDGADMIGGGSSDVPAKVYAEGAGTKYTKELVVVGPEYWTLHQATLREHFDGLIIDEAHMGLKNEKAERNKALHAWNPDLKMLMLLTGTPMTTSPADFMEYIKILSKGEHFGGMTRKQFEDEYLEESPVPTALGLLKTKGPKTHIKADKRDELAGMIARWTHVAAPKDVRGKTLPAVRIEESKHAHMVGIQAQLYALRMAALSDADRERLSDGSGVLADDELAGLAEDARREVSAAKAIASCPAYKPASDERYVPTYDTIPDRTGKMTKRKVEWETFDPDALMDPKRKKLAGRWPTIEEIGEHRAALYGIHFTELTGADYSAVSGTKITAADLAKMKALGWPMKIRNPEAGPLGIRCRGYDTPLPPDPRVETAIRLQREYALAFEQGVPDLDSKGRRVRRTPSKDEALQHAAESVGVDYHEDGGQEAQELLSMRPDATEHHDTVSYGGTRVQEGETWVSDTRGSLHLLYRRDDWDDEAQRPKPAGGIELARHGGAVEVLGLALKPPKDAGPDWEIPHLRFDAHASEAAGTGKAVVIRSDTGEAVTVSASAITVPRRSLLDPGMRADRARADVSMVVGNAKAEEFMAHVARFHQTTGAGPDGERQMVVFANGILEGCRTMEASLRLQGFRDVNEVIEGSPHHDPTDPGPSPNGRYFVTYIGGTYTGDRDLNVSIFQKTKDKLGRDSKTSVFVDKCMNGRRWNLVDGGTHPDIQMSQWTPEQRNRIQAAFGVRPPEAHYLDKGTVKFFYGNKRSAAILREIVLAGDPKAMHAAGASEADPEKAEAHRQRGNAATKRIAELQAEYADLVRAGSVTDPPLAQKQITVYNNCEVIVCSDAAQVGMNLGNAVEMVMYDDLGSPMAEWQRITRCARMLPPAVSASLLGTPEKPGPFRLIREQETALFAPGSADAGPEGQVKGLKFGRAALGDVTLAQGLGMIEQRASEMAANTKKDVQEGWDSIVAKCRVAKQLGGAQAAQAFRELANLRTPGGAENVIEFGDMTHRNPEAGTYGTVEVDEPTARIKHAIEGLSEEHQAMIAKAGFVAPGPDGKATGSLDPTAVYMAMRASDIMERIEARRPEVAKRLRGSSAGVVVTDSDVMNVVLDELPPEDRAVLKNKKYLVNVRRIGVSATVPQMVTVTHEDEETGEKIVQRVHVGYEREDPIKPIARVRATGRARMVSNESLMRSIQDGVQIRTELDYQTTDAADVSSISRTDIRKAIPALPIDRRFHA